MDQSSGSTPCNSMESSPPVSMLGETNPLTALADAAIRMWSVNVGSVPSWSRYQLCQDVVCIDTSIHMSWPFSMACFHRLLGMSLTVRTLDCAWALWASWPLLCNQPGSMCCAAVAALPWTSSMQYSWTFGKLQDFAVWVRQANVPQCHCFDSCCRMGSTSVPWWKVYSGSGQCHKHPALMVPSRAEPESGHFEWPMAWWCHRAALGFAIPSCWTLHPCAGWPCPLIDPSSFGMWA